MLAQLIPLEPSLSISFNCLQLSADEHPQLYRSCDKHHLKDKASEKSKSIVFPLKI